MQQYKQRIDFFHPQTLGKISSTELRISKPWLDSEYTNEHYIDTETLHYIRSHSVYEYLQNND